MTLAAGPPFKMVKARMETISLARSDGQSHPGLRCFLRQRPRAASDHFLALTAVQRAALVAFLNSL